MKAAILAVLSLLMTVPAVSAQSGTPVILNGEFVTLDCPPDACTAFNPNLWSVNLRVYNYGTGAWEVVRLPPLQVTPVDLTPYPSLGLPQLSVSPTARIRFGGSN